MQLQPQEILQPGEGEVVVALRYAVIHPSDFGMIAGTYGRQRELPAVGGREGVGEVVAVGEGVEASLMGQHVRMPEEPGAWAQAVCSRADALRLLPLDLPMESAAQAFVNPPTALRLLDDFVELQAGDWIIQNAGNSAVGFCVAGYARHRGINCLSVVRDPARWESPLKAAGAVAVIEEGAPYFKEIDTITSGHRPKLGLNSVGGESVMSLIKSMAPGGTVVTFGGMVGEKVRFPTRELIFNDLNMRGFWMDRWLRQETPGAVESCLQMVYDFLAEGVMAPPVDSVYPFADALEAVEYAGKPGRSGKVLIRSEWRP